MAFQLLDDKPQGLLVLPQVLLFVLLPLLPFLLVRLLRRLQSITITTTTTTVVPQYATSISYLNIHVYIPMLDHLCCFPLDKAAQCFLHHLAGTGLSVLVVLP